MRVLSSLKDSPLGASHAASRALTCAACDQEPQHPDEWEQWIIAVRKAVRRQAITIDAGTTLRTGRARFPGKTGSSKP